MQALSPGSRAKSTTPANVLKALAEEPRTQLVDIRAAGTVKTQGTPVLSSTKRRLLSLPYTRVSVAELHPLPASLCGTLAAKFCPAQHALLMHQMRPILEMVTNGFDPASL